MNPFAFFTLELVVVALASAAVIRVIVPALEPLLEESCGSEERARFWTRFTQLALVLAPMLLVVLFTDAGELAFTRSALPFRGTLYRLLTGELLALSAVGFVVWRFAFGGREG